MEEDASNKFQGTVKGSLKKHLDFWRSIGASKFVLDTIEFGYKIPFYETPEESFSLNNQSALKNKDFVSEALEDLIKKGCLIKVPFKPHVVNPLTVATNSQGKKRLILDLRIPNKKIWKQKIKFEDWRQALNYFEKGSFLFKFDLKSGYFHFDIFHQMQTYLGFCFEGKFYCFTVMAFGISSAPYLFSKCLRTMVKYWREHAIKIVMFLDDGFGMDKSFVKCRSDAEFVKDSLVKAGFFINQEKSIWDPQMFLEWTGLVWNGHEYHISIPQRRINDLFAEISRVSNHLPCCTARSIAKLVGKIISMMPVIGNVARLMTRNLYELIQNRISWDNVFKIQEGHYAFDEIFFWKDTVVNLNRRYLLQSTLPETVMFSDASGVAAGAYSVNLRDSVFHAFWSPEEASSSSTFRELKAVLLAFKSFEKRLSNKSVTWFTDSQNCVRIINTGSFKSELQSIAVEIYSLCVKNNIVLNMQWVPRVLNEQADLISKLIDYDDWGVSDEFFSYMNSLWGPFQVDRFANNENNKLHRFNSVVWTPNCEAVDAFSENWSDTNSWLVPPIYLICKTLRHIVNCNAHGTLIVPKWPSSIFWPLIVDRDSFCASHIQEALEFSYNGIYVQGRNKNALFGSEKFKGNVLAIRLGPRK